MNNSKREYLHALRRARLVISESLESGGTIVTVDTDLNNVIYDSILHSIDLIDRGQYAPWTNYGGENFSVSLRDENGNQVGFLCYGETIAEAIKVAQETYPRYTVYSVSER